MHCATCSCRWDAQRRNKIEAFYEARDFMPVWSDTARAERLRAILEHAFEQGLRASDYAVPDNASGSRLELALTDALFRYAHDVREGRAKPTDVYTDVRLRRFTSISRRPSAPR